MAEQDHGDSDAGVTWIECFLNQSHLKMYSRLQISSSCEVGALKTGLSLTATLEIWSYCFDTVAGLLCYTSALCSAKKGGPKSTRGPVML